MKGLAGLISKKNLFVLGLMSGTSADGLDLALCRVQSRGKRYELKLHEKGFYKYPDSLREEILGIASMASPSKANLVRLDRTLAEFYSRKVVAFIKRHRIRRIDLIGSHGQTVYHDDSRLSKSNHARWGTIQIGNGAVLAALTGIPVVSDFRINDVALGGSGAPLTPLCHYHLFGNRVRDIAVLNIGGITNLTWLPGRSALNAVKATDCGPGNMMIDQVMEILFNKRYDSGGKIALSGKVNNKLLSSFKREAWFKAPMPKSLGREQFGSERVRSFLKAARGLKLSKADIIATASELTVDCVVRALHEYGSPSTLIVCGGGVHNRYFMRRLTETLPDSDVNASGESGIDPDYVEAASFALLAVMFVRNDPANLPWVTGAVRQTVLGRLTLP